MSNSPIAPDGRKWEEVYGVSSLDRRKTMSVLMAFDPVLERLYATHQASVKQIMAYSSAIAALDFDGTDGQLIAKSKEIAQAVFDQHLDGDPLLDEMTFNQLLTRYRHLLEGKQTA